MSKYKTGRITVTLPTDVLATFHKIAAKKKISTPSFLRIYLTEIAESEEKKAA